MASTSPEQIFEVPINHEATSSLHSSPNSCITSNKQTSTGNMSTLDTTEEDTSLSENLVNPPVPDELGEAECLLLRGDAIGTTAYTHRWVLNTLLTITESLPQYLAEGDKCLKSNPNSNDEDVNEADSEQTNYMNGSNILELEEEVENAACQLWDMTAEPDVVSYLLNLDVVDILQLAKEIITLSRAPRLTEVVVGVVANLCCQAEGCQKIVESESLLLSCLAILHTTDDVPTLVEAFRLLKLLLWHVTHRVPLYRRTKYPLVIALKNNEVMKEALVFLLKNSLNDTLLNSVFEFLEALLYLWLPTDQCYMAAHYSISGLIEGVVMVMRHFLKDWEKKGEQEDPIVIHRGVLILYSFVSTPGVQIISSFDQYESLLEPILVRYVEHLAKVEKVEELYEEERAEKLMYALGLCELLVPTMRHPNILLHICKLLSLIHGGNYHYIVVQSKENQEKNKSQMLKHKASKRHRRHSSKSRKQSCSSEENHDHIDVECSSKKHSEQKNNAHTEQKAEMSSERNGKGKEEETVRSPISASDAQAKDEGTTFRIKECFKKDSKSTSESLKESLSDYCIRVVKCCTDLDAVLTAVNECHVHEVQLFFQSVRLQEPTLVGQLQEQILDTGSHNRLVTILADMYT